MFGFCAWAVPVAARIAATIARIADDLRRRDTGNVFTFSAIDPQSIGHRLVFMNRRQAARQVCSRRLVSIYQEVVKGRLFHGGLHPLDGFCVKQMRQNAPTGGWTPPISSLPWPL